MPVIISGTTGVDTPALNVSGNPAFVLGNIIYLTTGTGATYTPTAGTRAIYVELAGGGGGGGGVAGNATAGTAGLAGGGGGGGYAAKFITDMAQTFTYSIGAGGAGGAAGANNGVNGGATTFVGSVTGTVSSGVSGGGIGITAAAEQDGNGGRGATPSGGDINLEGYAGVSGFTSGANFRVLANPGTAPVLGGGARGNGVTNTAGSAGISPGGGGQGGAVSNSATSRAGGAGAAGIIRITEFF